MIINPKDKDKLIEIFQTSELKFEVWAYGSRVDGSAHSGSDLDLVIRAENLEPIEIDEFVRLFDLIKDSTIPILVEFRDWARLRKSFWVNIIDNHEVLFSNIDNIKA